MPHDLTHRYLHGPGVDQILADEYDDGTTHDVYWALTDHQGSVRDVVELAGATATVANHIKYDSFGNITAESDGTVDFRFTYTGRELDETTDLYYYRARYYDAETGRFISEDPIAFEAGDTNLYRYVSNTPLTFTDPSGLCWSGINSSYYDSSTYGASTMQLGNLTYTPTLEEQRGVDMLRDIDDYRMRVGPERWAAETAASQQWLNQQLSVSSEPQFSSGLLGHAEGFLYGVGTAAIGMGKGIGKMGKFVASAAWDMEVNRAALLQAAIGGSTNYKTTSTYRSAHWGYANEVVESIAGSLNKFGASVSREYEYSGGVAATCYVAESVLRNIPIAGRLGSNIADIGETGYDIQNTISFGQSTVEIGATVTAARLSGMKWTRGVKKGTGGWKQYELRHGGQQTTMRTTFQGRKVTVRLDKPPTHSKIIDFKDYNWSNSSYQKPFIQQRVIRNFQTQIQQYQTIRPNVHLQFSQKPPSWVTQAIKEAGGTYSVKH